jgi:hypothetical protein
MQWISYVYFHLFINFGFVLFHIINDDQFMEKWIDLYINSIRMKIS